MYKWGKTVAVLVALSLVGVACGDDDTDDPAIGTTTTAEPSPTTAGDNGAAATEVTIVAEDYVFSEAPSEIEAGVVDLTFENAG